MTKSYITDMKGNTADASSVTKPSDRHFRNAWVLNGDVISEDMTKAKEIFKDKIRSVRQPLLDAEDVVSMKALEAGDSAAQSAGVTQKNALRDATSTSAIDAADNITKLKAAWDASTLGTSPYA